MADDPPLPELSEQELLARAIRIKPVMAGDDGKLYALKPLDIETDPISMAGEPAEETPGLKELMTVTTVHSFSAKQFFMADTREVLAQIPPDILSQVTAFQVKPDVNQPLSDGGLYHRGVTVLYGGELPASVRGYPVVYKRKAIYPTPEDIDRTSRIKVMKVLHLKAGTGKQRVARVS